MVTFAHLHHVTAARHPYINTESTKHLQFGSFCNAPHRVWDSGRCCSPRKQWRNDHSNREQSVQSIPPKLRPSVSGNHDRKARRIFARSFRTPSTDSELSLSSTNNNFTSTLSEKQLISRTRSLVSLDILNKSWPIIPREKGKFRAIEGVIVGAFESRVKGCVLLRSLDSSLSWSCRSRGTLECFLSHNASFSISRVLLWSSFTPRASAFVLRS